MSYRLIFSPRPTYLHVNVTGDNSPFTVQGYLEDMRQECERRGIMRVLLEEHLDGPSLSMADIYGIVSMAAGKLWPTLAQIAYVDTNPVHDTSLMQFAETAAHNRSLNVRVFPTVVQAAVWLTDTAAPDPKEPGDAPA